MLTRAQWMRIRLEGSCRPLPRFEQEHPHPVPGRRTLDASRGFLGHLRPVPCPSPWEEEGTDSGRAGKWCPEVAGFTHSKAPTRLRTRRPSSAPARSGRICSCAGTPRFKRGQKEPLGFPGKDLTVFMWPVGREKPPAFRSKDTRGARAWSERGPVSPLVEVPH